MFTPEHGNVHVREGDGYDGWPEHAPFVRFFRVCKLLKAWLLRLDSHSNQQPSG